MATKKDVFPAADISQILAKLSAKSANYPSYDDFLVDLVKTLDSNKNGVIEFSELCSGMQKLGFDLSY